MKSVLILQARMGSDRLPGKSMMPLAGKPLLYRILERVLRCQSIDQIVVAAPDTNENDILEKVANELNVSIFRGSENDVLDRYYKAAKDHKADLILRIPADNFAPQPEEIEKILDFHIKNNLGGFSSNLSEVFHSGYPDGIGAEVFSFDLLHKAWLKNLDQKYREHVHLNFFDYESQLAFDETTCPVKTISCPELFRRPDIILDINTLSQYEFAKKLYEYLYPKNKTFAIQDILQWHDTVYAELQK